MQKVTIKKYSSLLQKFSGQCTSTKTWVKTEVSSKLFGEAGSKALDSSITEMKYQSASRNAAWYENNTNPYALAF